MMASNFQSRSMLSWDDFRADFGAFEQGKPL